MRNVLIAVVATVKRVRLLVLHCHVNFGGCKFQVEVDVDVIALSLFHFAKFIRNKERERNTDMKGKSFLQLCFSDLGFILLLTQIRALRV